MNDKPGEKAFRSPLGPHLWEIRAVRDLLWLLGAVLAVWLLYLVRSIALPAFVGLLLAYLAHPLLTAARLRWRVPLAVSIVSILLMVILTLAGAGIWLGPVIKLQSTSLVENIPEYLQNLNNRYGLRIEDLAGNFKIPEGFFGPQPIVASARNILGTTTDIMLLIILLPIYFAFFSWHFQTIVQDGHRYFQLDRYPRAHRVLQRMDEAVGTFFRARVLISAMIGVVYAFGWWLADVPYWFLLGGITGFFSIIPYLSIAGWLLALVFKYLDMAIQGPGFDFMAVIFWPSLVFGIGNFLEAWVFTPWIHGRTTQLSPVMILTVVLIGGVLAGFWGLLLSIPVAICLNILFLEYFPPSRNR